MNNSKYGNSGKTCFALPSFAFYLIIASAGLIMIIGFLWLHSYLAMEQGKQLCQKNGGLRLFEYLESPMMVVPVKSRQYKEIEGNLSDSSINKCEDVLLCNLDYKESYKSGIYFIDSYKDLNGISNAYLLYQGHSTVKFFPQVTSYGWELYSLEKRAVVASDFTYSHNDMWVSKTPLKRSGLMVVGNLCGPDYSEIQDFSGWSRLDSNILYKKPFASIYWPRR